MGSIGESFSKVGKGDYKHLDPIDPDLNLTRDDYKHLTAAKQGDAPPKLTISQEAPPVPKMADILAAPRPPKIGETQIVSIAVTDDVPLKDVLVELAKLADVDIDLDAGISGGINFIAKDRPFNEVIDRIAALANLRYTMKDGVLHVERDMPYIKNYPVSFLNVDRDSASAVNLSTNVLSGGGGSSGGGSGGSSGGGGGGSSGGSSGGGSGGGLTTGSTSSVQTKSSGDFWKSFEAGIQQIIAYQEPDHLSANTMLTEPNANAASGGRGAPPLPAAPSATPGGNNASAQAGATNKAEYTLNRQAGVLTVNADNRKQEMVERYIEELRKNASAQVLIEAKIIEVDLNDQYASGINWQTVGTRIGNNIGIGNISTQFPLRSPTNPLVPTSTSNFVQFSLSGNTENILEMLEAFGTVRTLSSPRLHAINNQQSTLTFATNHVYFTVSVTAPTTTTVGTTTSLPTQPTVTSTINTVPIGIMMTMMPSIDLKDNEVTLSVRPTLSTIFDFVSDPAVAIEAALYKISGVSSEIPEVQVRELDSTLKLKSGQTMVIGGLMQQEATNTDSGVPFVSGLPIIGNLFKSVSKSSHNKELVLLIKASIVGSHGSLNGTDTNIFHKFSQDPRPVSF